MMEWFVETDPSFKTIPANTQSWLAKPKILTQSVIRHYGSFQVERLGQHRQPLLIDEVAYLQQADGEILVREVLLKTPVSTFSYGRVLIPDVTYYANKDQFDTLGNKPLGETLLHNKQNVQRSEFEFAVLQSTDALHQRAVPYANVKALLFARRSLFHIDDKPLGLVEVFYPNPTLYHEEDE